MKAKTIVYALVLAATVVGISGCLGKDEPAPSGYSSSAERDAEIKARADAYRKQRARQCEFAEGRAACVKQGHKYD